MRYGHGLRLLFLLPFAPRLDATHGGAKVTAQLLTNLARCHRIGLVYLRASDEPGLDQAVTECCSLIEEVRRPATSFSFAERRKRFVSLLRGTPLWAIASAVPAYAEKVGSIAAGWRPHVAQLEYHVMGQYASVLRRSSIPCVLVEHEPGAQAARDRWRCGGRGFAGIVQYLDLRAWKRYERRIVGDVQAVVVFTQRDRQAMARFGQKTPIYKIPFGTVPPAKALNPLGRMPPSLLFIGDFIHPPNIEAALRLAHYIFPIVQTKFPDAMLYIVGDHPPVELQKSAAERILITGRVPDVTPYLDRAAIVVAPLRRGGGMRVKVLEALGAGKPLVASRRAVEGLELSDGENVVLAESDSEFSAAIMQLLNAPEQRQGLARCARSWACANCGWEVPVRAYEDLYDELVRSRSERCRERVTRG